MDQTHDTLPRIDPDLVRRLIAAQFPDWAGLPVAEVQPQGWDNRSFRLGEEMVVRLPSAERYAAQVEKEARWLPRLAPDLPLPIPVPLAMGAPGEGYPFAWSVNRWIPGQTARRDGLPRPARFAADLAAFLRALHAIPASDGPAPGAHNFHRGGDLSVYDDETRAAARALSHRWPEDRLLACWAGALATSWQHAPVWVHGDIAANNLILRDGNLSGVIDFGSSAVGDPACDLVIAWTLFEGEARSAFRLALPFDPDTWVRARGWALWKALITVAEGGHAEAPMQAAVIDAVLIESEGGP